MPRAALALLLVATAAAAAPYAVDDAVRPFALEDQHGERAAVDEAVRVVVLSRDMDAGEVVKQALAGADQRLLDAHHAVYVADVSGMPAMITRLFALPKLRGRPYRILLDRDGSVAGDFPYAKGKPTLVVLDRLRVARVLEPASGEELRAAIEAAGPPPAGAR